ncbi:hypothetical protein [Nocardia altamirensis]|uniref:hypothetical protein n=1 Tax=Nocardia altamirensis TaxID=472158 RepID=UPI000B0CC897|nr:hypothetical protein [Nocardia altamirensis]
MTGGLRGLIASSRAETPRLRPRPVGRFESGGMSGPDIDTEVETPVRAAERPAPEQVEVATAPRTAAPAVASPVPSIVVRDSRIREPEPVRAERRTTAPALRPSVPIPAPQVPAGEPRDTPTVTVVQHVSAEQPIAPRRLGHESELPRPEPAARPPARAEHERGALVSPPLPDVPVPATHRSTDRMDRRAPQSVSDPVARAADPVVQVSIGRIEVRASTAAKETPARASTTRSAVIGLDDYLNQRGAR